MISVPSLRLDHQLPEDVLYQHVVYPEIVIMFDMLHYHFGDCILILDSLLDVLQMLEVGSLHNDLLIELDSLCFFLHLRREETRKLITVFLRNYGTGIFKCKDC